MTTRTFRQQGLAFGPGPGTANITAKIDNVVVYQGPVTTETTMPSLPDLEYTVTNTLFSWTANVDFSGNQVIDVTIDDSATLLLAELESNYVLLESDTGNIGSSGPDGFLAFNYTQFGNTYINGSLREVTANAHSDLPGMWWWTVPAGGNFVENITIDAGQDVTPA
jgi:hypothetical protein